jgi:UDP-galactopyranose mutase
VRTTYDYIIVGSGFFGAVMAHELTTAGRSVLVLDKRRHIGGNCHSEDDPTTGVNVHTYGTHIFHTADRGIWDYVNQFSEFNRYQHRVLTVAGGRVYSMPINLGTINQFFGTRLTPQEAEQFLAAKREPIAAPSNLEDKAISLIGRELYQAFIKGYTQKQWGCDPKRLPANIITRLPVRTSFNDCYFNDRYQGIPINGYTPIFERLLERIPVELGVDFLNDAEYWRGLAKRKVIYTGPIDAYFAYSKGRLNWRSVRFEVEHHRSSDYQGTSVMNYADVDMPFTRIHEPKHLHPERKTSAEMTTTIREYPHLDHDAPYYPVNFAEDRDMYCRYRALADTESHVIFGGRLASYKYYDMHQVIGAALAASRRELADEAHSRPPSP